VSRGWQRHIANRDGGQPRDLLSLLGQPRYRREFASLPCRSPLSDRPRREPRAVPVRTQTQNGTSGSAPFDRTIRCRRELDAPMDKPPPMLIHFPSFFSSFPRALVRCASVRCVFVRCALLLKKAGDPIARPYWFFCFNLVLLGMFRRKKRRKNSGGIRVFRETWPTRARSSKLHP
jgi:hypothetical protein